MGKLIRTNFSRNEMRRDRRYLAPAITLTVRGVDYQVRDWSLGGFRARRALCLPLRGQITGQVRIERRREAYSFTAEAVRDDANAEAVGFRFVALSPSLSHALDRAIAWRVAGLR
jgi:hypothetical protein